VVFGSVKGAHLEGCTAVNRGVAGGANLELGELVKLNLNGVVRVTFALRLVLTSLESLC